MAETLSLRTVEIEDGFNGENVDAVQIFDATNDGISAVEAVRLIPISQSDGPDVTNGSGTDAYDTNGTIVKYLISAVVDTDTTGTKEAKTFYYSLRRTAEISGDSTTTLDTLTGTNVSDAHDVRPVVTREGSIYADVIVIHDQAPTP